MLRERLLRRLEAIPDDVPLVAVVAPPGYGKSTLLTQWAEQDPRDVAWVAVDDADKDLTRLITKVVLALHEISPVGVPLLDAVMGRDAAWRHPRAEQLADQLAEELRGRRRPFVLVLDGVERLAGGAGLSVLVDLLTSLPRGSQAAVASRYRLRLGRHGRDGQSVELGATDLAFTESEAATVLREMGDEPGAAAVHDLVLATEGWPVGVRLAALAGWRPDDPSAMERTDRDTGHYVRDEVLHRLDPDVVSFLLDTSVLDRLSAPLCAAVAGEEGSARLVDVVDRNLFLVPMDHSGEWYRHQHGLGRVLRAELDRREPGRATLLHARASAWFESQGMAGPAIRHALQSDDVVRSARLVTTRARAVADDRSVARVRSWLDAFTDDDLRAFPPLGVVAAWTWGLSGDALRAKRALLTAERGTFAGLPPDGSASLRSGRAMVRAALAPFGIERMLADADVALNLEPPGSPWRPVAAALLGCARLLNGLRVEAVWPLELAADEGREVQPAVAQLALAQRALLAADDDGASAEGCASAALGLMREHRLEHFAPSVVTWIAAARVAERRGDVEVAWQHIGRAEQLVSAAPTAFTWLAAQSAIHLGRLHLDLRDPEGARSHAEECRRQLTRLLSEGVLRDQLDQLTKAIAVVGDDSGTAPPAGLSPAELRILRLLPTNLSVREIAEELHVSRNTVKTQVTSLYRKLQVSGRSEALGRARELGLVEPRGLPRPPAPESSRGDEAAREAPGEA